MKEIYINARGELTLTNFQLLCEDFDVIFVRDIYDEIKAQHVLDANQMNVWQDYLKYIKANARLSALSYSCSKSSSEVIKNLKEEEEQKNKSIQVSMDMVKFWGEGLTPLEYETRQEKLERLCEQNGGSFQIATDTQKNYYKQIIQLEALMETLITTDIKQYQEVLKTYTMVCDKCGINPKQIQDRQDNNQGSFGMFIKMIEDEEPIEELGSFDSMKKMLEIFFFGHLAEVTGNHNPLKSKYDAEMQEYSVKVADFADLLNLEENYEDEEERGKKEKFIKRFVKGKRKMKLVKVDGDK